MHSTIGTKEQPIIIAGAGIAGLSAGLALAKKGFFVEILEANRAPQEVGAGLQLASNATRILENLGLLGACQKLGVEPDTLCLNDGKAGTTRLNIPLKEIAKRRWQSPYLSIHRADLQRVLLEAAQNNTFIALLFNHRLTSQRSDTDGVVVTVKTEGLKKELKTGFLVGCDGVWSALRQSSPNHDKSTFSGFIAWRTTVDASSVPQALIKTNNSVRSINVWMGAHNHLVAYPIQSGRAYNFVAITRGRNPGETWSRQGDKSALIQLFNGWNATILDFFQSVDNWTYWPLFAMTPIKFSQSERVVYLGDTAHSFLPFAAQGAAMAIEDAATLSEALVLDLPLAEAVNLFSSARQKRVAAVSKRGNFNGFVYHLAGPMAVARNLVMKMRPAESFMAGLDWLYSFDATRLR